MKEQSFLVKSSNTAALILILGCFLLSFAFSMSRITGNSIGVIPSESYPKIGIILFVTGIVSFIVFKGAQYFYENQR